MHLQEFAIYIQTKHKWSSLFKDSGHSHIAKNRCFILLGASNYLPPFCRKIVSVSIEVLNVTVLFSEILPFTVF